MADVMNRLRGERDVGQMILVSGLLIAVTLLILVVLLNTVIYTENVATRGLDSDAGEAIEFHEVVLHEGENVISDANHEGLSEWSDLKIHAEESLGYIADHQRERAIQRGVIAETDIDLSEGAVVRDEDEIFADANPLVTDVSELRTFEVTVNTESTFPEVDSLEDVDDEDLDDTISILLDDNAATWQFSLIIIDSSMSLIEIDPNDQREVLCQDVEDGGQVAIDVEAGMVNGEDCPGFGWNHVESSEEMTTPLEIAFNNGNDATGSFYLVADGTSTETVHTYHPIVYAADLDVTYSSSELDYHSTFTVYGEAPP